MNIKPLIKEAYQTMIDKGFFSCPECESNETLEGYPDPDCKTCHGSSINPNKNIGEQLMLIVSELSEALEAHRVNRFADINNFITNYWDEISEGRLSFPVNIFESNIKDTFEDEIADVFLRLFSLCGYLGIEPQLNSQDISITSDNIAELLLGITQRLVDQREELIDRFTDVYTMLILLTEKFNIPIEKHIAAKMAYNKTRPHKHGKEY